MRAWIYQLSRKSPEYFEDPGDITKAKLLEVFLQARVHTWGIKNYFRDARQGDPLLFKIGAPEAVGVMGIAIIEEVGAKLYKGGPGVRFSIDRQGTRALSKHPIPFDWVKRRVSGVRANLVDVGSFWDQFARQLLRRGILFSGKALPNENNELPPEVDTVQRLSPEGRAILRRHLSFERSRANRVRVLKAHKAPYSCESCGFEFGKTYGASFSSYIQVHHKRMVSRGEYVPQIEDFALLCANCHAVAHWKTATDPLSVERIRKLWIRNNKKTALGTQ